MAATELDIPQLSSYCSLPQASINTLLDAPTAELVRNLLGNISVKAREHNELVSEKLRADVELENVIRGGESKSRVLRGSVEKAHKEAEDLRQKLQLAENARVSVETELEKLKVSTSASTSELSSLRVRISSLESSNRDTLSLLDSKTTAYDSLAGELAVQHQKIVELRREVSTLEQSVQSANAVSSSAKFHEQGLQQEIEQLKRSNDWLDSELKTKSAEYSKYRKEKSLRIAELQRQSEDASSTIDRLNRTETTLRRRLDEVNQKADDAFQKIQQMQEELAKRDESFKVELDAAKRLTELTQKSADRERDSRADLVSLLESAKEEASDQIGRLTAELDTEHGEREAADTKIAELEVQIEHLQTEIATLQSQDHAPNTPHRGINGFAVITPTRGDTTPRAFSPGSSRVKGTLSMTQMYSNYNDLKSELDTEKRRTEKLTSTIDDMIQEMESRQPEIEELRADHTRLESEVADMSSLIDVIGKERDQAIKGAKRWEGQVEGKIEEGEVLRQQLRDLSSQVKILLMESHLRDQGYDQISLEARAQLERLAHGQVDDEKMDGETDTARYISENLVAFRGIVELEEQNAKLIKVTREVGERMEHEESLRKQSEAARDWEDLQQKYERCKDEINSLVTQSQSYIRERDMFRRMLSHRGQLPPNSDAQSIFGESVNEDGPPANARQAGVLDSIEGLPSSKDMADYAKLLKDMQTHFDAYRKEAATDRSTLKEQVDALSRQNGELRSEIARSDSQVSLSHERYEMLQANYAMLKNENGELQKRSHIYSDAAVKQDLRVQQVAEDLVEAKGLLDSMRNENANLKAEKDFWKTVEKRISEDNESLLNERSRLNSLNANLQNLLNEREHSDTEARRRLQSQIDRLEHELQTTKSKLSEEVEENKRSTQRREYDHEQSQKKIDDLVSSLGSIREELIAAKTTKDYLSSRVDELTIELRSAEERLSVIQSTSEARASGGSSNGILEGGQTSEDSSLSKEQELGVQVSELKRDLGLRKAELDNAKGQIEQYKAISQSSEDELISLNETQDLYRQETDKIIEEKDSKIKNLEQRVQDMISELTSTTSELSDLRNEQTENGRRLDDQKKAFEAELAQLKDQDDRHAAAAQYYQEDLKAQAEIAQQAQRNYENELVKHADAAKALQKIRGDYNDLKLEVVEIKTEAESARSNLSQSEESWAESRERYEREVAELKSARQSLKTQNDHLHRQLETITTQTRKREASGDEPMHEGSPGSGLENLQEVIKYLRREKEIVDVQLELSTQEAKRLKQQLDYTQSQLDDTRLRLNQQRRVEADSERTALDHSKLMETINDLNTLRESNVTLRAESRQAQASLATRTKEIEDLRALLEPLQAEIRELKNERENQDVEAKLLKENCDRWQQRAQNVLQKYDRVDPAELEALKEQIQTLEAERDDLKSSKVTLQEQLDQLSSQITQVQEQSNERVESIKSRLTEQFKSRSKQLSDRIKEKDTALQTAMTERQGLEERISGLSEIQNQLGEIRAERDAAVEKAAEYDATANSNTGNGGEEGEVDENQTTNPARAELQTLQTKLEAAEATANQERSEAANIQRELAESRSRTTELTAQITGMQQSIDALKTELTQLRATQQQDVHSANNDAGDQMAKLQQELSQAQQEIEILRTAASVNETLINAPREDGSKSVADQVTEHVEAVRKELEARHNVRVKEVDELLERRTNAMKAQLSKKLTEGKTQIRESLQAEHEQALQTLGAEHEQAMEKLRIRHKEELEELRRNEENRFADLRATWDCEHQSKNTTGELSAKPEGQKSTSPWQPTEAEARAFIQSNDTVKAILRGNITQQVNKTREEISNRIKEEHEKTLADTIKEFQFKANTAKEHAVALEGKKTALQVTIANNKVKMSQIKLEIVQKAAQETPQRPVQEVWAIAKDARPPPAPTTQPQQHTSKPQDQVPTTSGQPAPATQGPTVSSPKNEQKTTQVNAEVPTPTFGRPTPVGPAPKIHSSQAQQNQGQKLVAAQPLSNAANTSQRPPSQANPNPFQQGSNVPLKPPQGTLGHHPNAGTGPGVLRGLQQSGLPMARGGPMRGNTGARGRGSGIPRGGPQNVETNRAQGQPQARASPTSGMNAGAKQFVPGNKRPREDGQDGQPGGDGSNGKRMRGGGAGSQ